MSIFQATVLQSQTTLIIINKFFKCIIIMHVLYTYMYLYLYLLVSLLYPLILCSLLCVYCLIAYIHCNYIPYSSRFFYMIHCIHGVSVLIRFKHCRVVHLLMGQQKETLLAQRIVLLVHLPLIIMLTESLKEFC